MLASKPAPRKAAAKRAVAAKKPGPGAAATTEAKRRRLSEMLRRLRSDVRKLSANADRLLERLS